MDQRLRLQAEVHDNASPKLRQISKELKEIRRTPGMEQAQKWFSGFNDTAGSFVKSGGGVAGTMGAIGIGGLTAATSLAVLVKQFKDLGDHTFAMKKLGQETGLTIDQIRRWEYVGNVFRVPIEQMDGALKTFGDKMVDFKRRRGELFGALNENAFGGEATKLLGIKDADAQFQEVLRFLSTIKDAAQRNRWAREFFGGDDLDALLTNGLPALEQALAKAKLKVAPISPEMEKQADKLAGSIVDLNQAWQNFELKIGPAFLSSLTAIVKTASQVFSPDAREGEEAQKRTDARIKALKDQDEANRAAAAKDQREGGAADERERAKQSGGAWGQESPDMRKKLLDALRQPSSFKDGGGLLHRMAYTGNELTPMSRGGSASDLLAAGVKEGVLAAFREWAAQSSAGGSTGGGGGLMNASFGGGGRGGDGLGGGSGGLGRRRGGAGGDPLDDGLRLKGQGAVKGGVSDRAMRAMSRLVGLGWTEEAAATAVGQAVQESHVKSDGPLGDTKRFGFGDKAAHGMFQWRDDRYRALKRFAEKRGKPWTDFDTQVDFFDAESKSHGQGAWRNERDLHRGNQYGKRFEGYGDDSFGARLKNSEAALRRYREGGHRNVPTLVEEDRKTHGGPASVEGGIEAHVHIHDGQVRGATARSSGAVAPPKVHLRRGPTMTEPSISA